MEENKKMENGMISEEALDQVAGGLNVKKEVLIGALAAAGVAIVGGGAYAAWKKWGGKKKSTHSSSTPYMSKDEEKAWDDYFKNK